MGSLCAPQSQSSLGSRNQVNQLTNCLNLCPECQAIFDNWHERDNWSSARPGHLHHDVVGLQKSAGKGCLVCALFMHGLHDDTVQLLQQERPGFKSFVDVGLTNAVVPDYYHIKLLFYVEGDDLSTETRHLPRTVVEAYPSASSRDLEIGQIQDVVDCEENWTLIRKWLKICQDTHTACSQNSSDRQLPTRLLDVGVSDMDLKLRLSKSLPPEAPYLTLSHCWGGKVFTTLTRNNFQDFLSHIPTSSLSKTFIEAIISTRKLGFRYLWIDSLCIIQGDEADWQHEASMMGTVYANSELNIAASAAPNGDFGCFTTRKPGQVFACRVLARTERGSLQTSVWDCTIEQLSWELLDNNVLNSRAWVYQERFLAPRSLHFTAHQLAWECVSSRACETFPDSFIDNTVTAPAVSTCDSWNDTAQDIADKWAIVVSGYSSRSVTFSRDKLVAISGVSRLFAAKFGTTYLAGMWKEDLVKQLAWYTDQASENDALGSIPTWSWAAVNTGVIFQNPGMLNPDGCIRLVSILQATTVVSNDYFGEVKQGSIQLRCRVPCFGSVTKQHTSKIFTISSGSRGFLALIFLDATLYYLKDEMYFLALLRGTKWNDEPLLCGLVIEPTGPVECRRIGYFQVLGADRIQEFITAQQEASTVDKHFIREALGVDQDGNKMCIITII